MQTLAGTNGAGVRALVQWDPDGAGPRPPVVVLGGLFTVAGSAQAQNIATYDPTSGAWAALGSGTSGVGPAAGKVNALAVLPNGDLVAGGNFTSAGGVSCSSIARWDGASWRPLASGVNGEVWALCIHNGGLVAGGAFSTAGGVACRGVATWNGTAWQPLGAGFAYPASGGPGWVTTLMSRANGELVAGGWFDRSGTVLCNRIARWDGSSWSGFGSGLFGAPSALVEMPNGDMVAGGSFTAAGGVPCNRVARWNGTSWQPLGSGVDGTVMALCILNGELVAGGGFSTAGGLPCARVGRWNGTAWSALGSGLDDPSGTGSISALVSLSSVDLWAGGTMDAYCNLPHWDGATWHRLDGALAGQSVSTLASLAGDLVVGGRFTVVGAVDASCIAKWDGASWTSLGTGIGGSYPSVSALAVMPNGDLIAGGYFTMAGGVSASNIARWDGVSWTPLGSGLDNEVHALLVLPNGDLLAGGAFTQAGGVTAHHVARWDGSSWAAMGSFDGNVHGFARLPDGAVVACGGFTSLVAKWNGAAWSGLGYLGTNQYGGAIYTLAVLPNGLLMAGGAFYTVSIYNPVTAATWNGISWSQLSGPGGRVSALHVLPNGDVLAGGESSFSSGPQVMRWNGSAWSTVGSGPNDAVHDFVGLPGGDVIAGGRFTAVGGIGSAYLARLTTTCPATATVYGAGCTGPAGPVSLTATSLPWLGGTLRSRAAGFGSSSVAVSVIGLGLRNMPLSALTPIGLPNCDLLSTLNVADAHTPAGGAVDFGLTVPNSPALVGATFYHQFLQLELGTQGQLVSLSSSNGLALTLGMF